MNYLTSWWRQFTNKGTLITEIESRVKNLDVKEKPISMVKEEDIKKLREDTLYMLDNQLCLNNALSVYRCDDLNLLDVRIRLDSCHIPSLLLFRTPEELDEADTILSAASKEFFLERLPYLEDGSYSITGAFVERTEKPSYGEDLIHIHYKSKEPTKTRASL